MSPVTRACDPQTVSLTELLAATQDRAVARLSFPARAGTAALGRHTASGRATRRRRFRAAALSVAVMGGALLVVAAAAFALAGGRWFIISTPSMGESAPVGALIISWPEAIADIRPGDVISFHPGAGSDAVYTHRVRELTPGGITTQGDANTGPDPWLLGPADIIGRSAAVLPGWGWLIRALPMVLFGITALWILTKRWVPPTLRAPARILGLALVVAIPALVLRPFVAVRIVATSIQDGLAHASVISTGLLPVRVQAQGGSFVDLTSGASGTVSAPAAAGSAATYPISTALQLPPDGWGLLALCCALPLLWSAVVGLPAPTEARQHAD